MRVKKISSNPKKIYGIRNNRGVDLASSPLNIADNRASYMMNMISRNGMNRKRHGFSSIIQFRDESDTPLPINGIHTYVPKVGEDQIVIHAGTRLYRSDGTRIGKIEVLNQRSQSFYLNERLYIVGCGPIIEYNGSSCSYLEPYVPLVMTDADYRFNSARVIEDVNLLTTERKIKYDGTVYEDNAGIFNFDANTDFEKDVTIKVFLSPEHNEILLYAPGTEEKNPDEGTPYIGDPIECTFLLSNPSHGDIIKAEDIEIDGKVPYIFDANNTTSFFADIECSVRRIKNNEWRFAFSFNPSPQIENDLNIEVTYHGKTDNRHKIDSCTFGSIIGDDNNATRLMLSGGDDRNMCYISDSIHMEGCAYFPDTNFISVGNSQPVTAFLRLSDSTVGIFKKNEFYRYSFDFIADPQTFVTRLNMTGFKGSDEEGCINPYTAVNVNSDALVFTGEYVCGVANLSSSSSVEKYLKKRSSKLEGVFAKYSREELKNAICGSYDGRYYLFIAGDVYIGDTRYKVYESNKLDPGYEYEWWVWNGMDAYSIGFARDKMYIGTANGELLCENDEYRDIRIIKHGAKADVTYNTETGCFTVNSEITNGYENIKVKLTGYKEWLKDRDISTAIYDSKSGAECSFVTLSDEEYMMIHDGQRVRIKWGDGNYTTALVNTQANEEGYILWLFDGNMSPLNLEALAGAEVCIHEDGAQYYEMVQENDGWRLVDEHGNKTTWSVIDGISDYPTLIFYNFEDVIAMYHSPFMDLGNPIYTKTLFGITATVEGNGYGDIGISYETLDNASSTFVKGSGSFCFNSFNFSKISFKDSFVQTLSKRLYERNFNYIVIRLEFRGNNDISLDQINLIYTVNQIIKGAR